MKIQSNLDGKSELVQALGQREYMDVFLIGMVPHIFVAPIKAEAVGWRCINLCSHRTVSISGDTSALIVASELKISG